MSNWVNQCYAHFSFHKVPYYVVRRSLELGTDKSFWATVGKTATTAFRLSARTSHQQPIPPSTNMQWSVTIGSMEMSIRHVNRWQSVYISVERPPLYNECCS